MFRTHHICVQTFDYKEYVSHMKTGVHLGFESDIHVYYIIPDTYSSTKLMYSFYTMQMDLNYLCMVLSRSADQSTLE